MLAVTVATAVLGVGQTFISTRVGQEVMHRLRTDVFSHLQRQSLAFFTRTRGGEVQSRLTNDVAGMQSVVTSTATSIASNVTTAVGTAIAMVALSWRLSLLSLLVIPPAVWLTRRVALLRRDVTAKQQRRMADMLTQVDEGLSVSGVQLTKTLGATETTSARFAATSRELVDLEVRSQLAGRWRMATMSVVFAAIPAADLPRRGLPRDVRWDDHRDPGRVHRAAVRHLPPAHGPARRRRLHRQLDGPVQPDLRATSTSRSR